MKEKTRKNKFKALRILGKILLGLFLFILLLLLFIRSPWGQEIIKDRVIASISEQTGTTIELDRLFLTFSGNIFMEGLYLEDQQGDTLVYSRELEADVPLWPVIRGRGIAVNSLEWEGVRANIIRKDSIEGFNFEFLAESFAPADTTASATDTTASSQSFSLGDLRLSDFDVVYNDQVLGIESRFQVGGLALEMEETDLGNMRFSASHGSLSDARIDYRQTPVPENPNAEEAPMPVLMIGELRLKNVTANYESVPAGLLAEIDLQEFMIALPKADLGENIVEIDRLELDRSSILVWTSGTTSPEEPGPEEASEGFQWPDWNVEVGEIALSQNTISYMEGDARPEEGQFDPQALEIKELSFSGSDIFVKNGSAGANLEGLSFTETSGIELRNLGFSASIDDRSLSLEDLEAQLNESELEGYIRVTYNSIDELMEVPENSIVEARIQRMSISPEDILRIQPDLRANEYMQSLSRKRIDGHLHAAGSLADLEIPDAEINWGGSTSVTATGRVANLMEPENMHFDFPELVIISTRADVVQFISEEDLGINLPPELRVSGSIRGSTQDMQATASLNTSHGDIDLDGSFVNQEQIAFDADLEVRNLDLAYLLDNDQLGELNLTLTGKGEGANINTLDAHLETIISGFRYNDYPLEQVRITGEISNGRGPVTMQYKDDNLDLDMESLVILDSISPQINMNLDVAGANLQALGLSPRNVRVAFDLDGSFRGNANQYDINAEIIDGVTVYNQDSYLLGDFGFSARVRPDSTAMDISNQIVDVRLRSNADPGSFARALQRHYQSYLSDEIEVDTVNHPVNLQFHAQVRQNPILDEVFFTNLQELDTMNIDVEFHERNRSLAARVDLPFINYMGSKLDSLSLSMDSDPENFQFDLGFRSLNAGPVAIRKTSLEGILEDKTFYLDFNSFYDQEHLVHIQSEMTRRNDTVNFTLDPSEVILNSSLWEIPESNQILISKNFMAFEDFHLTRKDQRMEITDDREGVEKDHIAIRFDNFRLASFLSYLNPEEKLATGRLNGGLTIEEPFGTTGLLASLGINDLNVLEVPMGNLTMEASEMANNEYTFDLGIKEGNADLDLTGTFQPSEEGAWWDTELALNEIQMVVLEGFSLGEISGAEGSFSGNIQLSGTLAEPEYEGSLNFEDAGFTVVKLDAPFMLQDETINLDSKGIYFEDFNIEDPEKNQFTVQGEVLTESLLNPEFDLNLQATDFMLMNSTSEDHDLFYGKAIFDIDAQVTGTLNVPKISLDLDVGSNTNLTYIIPESNVGIEAREGIVLFVNRKDPDDILTQTREESYTVTGMEIDALLSIEEDAVFNVIIDEQTGDNFQVTGAGDLNFNIFANGRTTLSGRYEMSGGHYEMNLYGLVNRRFEIVEGSSITWAGDPFDANLDLRARYRVETSASSLMAAQTSGAATSVRNRFRQELPFLVYLNIDGELMQPVLSFGLDMPEEEQGAIGGQVYGRVQQVNQQEQELNKQVFSLLVLNRFYPEAGSDGSGGGTMAMARDNLNNALSDQLNLLSNNLLGDTGFQLDFGLDSYTDYQGDSPQERTQLDITAEKSFMNERLVVRVGSEVDVQGSNQAPGETTPLIGNVSIEYLLTEDGKWRLKGFRRNRYENVIEGQIIASGLALIFAREFNKFRELWESIADEPAQENEDQDNNQ